MNLTVLLLLSFVTSLAGYHRHPGVTLEPGLVRQLPLQQCAVSLTGFDKLNLATLP